MICVAFDTVNVVAFIPLKITAVVPVRLVPVSVTTVPTGPALGVNVVKVGLLMRATVKVAVSLSRLPTALDTVTV